VGILTLDHFTSLVAAVAGLAGRLDRDSSKASPAVTMRNLRQGRADINFAMWRILHF